MSTRTIEPIHVVLPDAEGGYYRFSKLPQLISEALRPDTEDADADPQGSYYVIRALDQMNYEKDLPQAAALPPGAPGYLHVVENSASKRPLEWRMGAVLNAGLVHLDWLNEWGESRKPPLVFSTVSAPEPQAATPAPVVAGGAEQRQARRWQMCLDAGLSMPQDTYAQLPRGINEIAKAERITRQALAQDLNAHRERLFGG